MVAIVRHLGVIDFSKSYMPIYSLPHLTCLSVIAFKLKTCFYSEKQEISCKRVPCKFYLQMAERSRYYSNNDVTSCAREGKSPKKM